MTSFVKGTHIIHKMREVRRIKIIYFHLFFSSPTQQKNKEMKYNPKQIVSMNIVGIMW